MNISQLIPEPFKFNHIEQMRTFHTKNAIRYTLVDNDAQYKWWFKHKKKHLFEARIMVKGVPHPTTCPFFLCIIKPTNNTTDEWIMTDGEWKITETGPMFMDLREQADKKTYMTDVIENWEDILTTVEEA